jgi:erythromycin esterase
MRGVTVSTHHDPSRRLDPASVTPLGTLDPDAPADDLDWLDDAVGDARVVAIGESAHYNQECYLLRHRLLRRLVERHGFGAYALESGFAEGWQVDAWVRGGDATLGTVLADGVTSLMGLWEPFADQLRWMRRYNRDSAERGGGAVGFYGVDLPGSMVSLRPGIAAVTEYLARADPDYRVDAAIRTLIAEIQAASPFSAPAAAAAYARLTDARRDALTAALADLTARLAGRALPYRERTGDDDYHRALRTLHTTVAGDALARAMHRDDHRSMLLIRETTLADTVEEILRRHDRIVLAAHNAHVQRWPTSLPGTAPTTTLGQHLADRLGDRYRVIGTTVGTGRSLNLGPDFYTGTLFTELPAAPPDSIDALLAANAPAGHAGPYAVDLRHLSPTDLDTVRAAGRQSCGACHAPINAPAAYDLLVHLPHVTAAVPDDTALAHAPAEVRDVFAAYRRSLPG